MVRLSFENWMEGINPREATLRSTIRPLSQATPSPAWLVTSDSPFDSGRIRVEGQGGLDRLQMGLCECWTGVGVGVGARRGAARCGGTFSQAQTKAGNSIPG